MICIPPPFDPSITTDGDMARRGDPVHDQRSHFPRRRHGRHGHDSRDASVEARGRGDTRRCSCYPVAMTCCSASRMTLSCMARPSTNPLRTRKVLMRALPRGTRDSAARVVTEGVGWLRPT